MSPLAVRTAHGVLLTWKSLTSLAPSSFLLVFQILVTVALS